MAARLISFSDAQIERHRKENSLKVSAEFIKEEELWSQDFVMDGRIYGHTYIHTDRGYLYARSARKMKDLPQTVNNQRSLDKDLKYRIT